MSDLTDLQRRILLTARDHPRATQKEISDLCDCSASYVSDVLNRYDSVDAFHSQLNAMTGIEPIQPTADFSQPPVWMEETEPIVDEEEFDEAVAEGLQIIGVSLKRGYKGLKTLIRKIRS